MWPAFCPAFSGVNWESFVAHAMPCPLDSRETRARMDRYRLARWSWPSTPFEVAKKCSSSYFQKEPAHSFAPWSTAPPIAASTYFPPSSRDRTLGSGRVRAYRNGPFAMPAYSGFGCDALAIFTRRSTASPAFVRSLMSVATTRLSCTRKTEALDSRHWLLMTASFRAKRI